MSVVAVIVLAFVTSSCFLRPNKRAARKSGVAALIDRASIFLDRIGDGDAARLSFKTVRPALCELAVYGQDADVKPTRDNPRILPCSSPDKARSEITETIDDLRTDALYFVEISAWEAGANKDRSETVVVKEARNSGGGGGGGGEPDGKWRDVVVARLDAPLLAAEVHRHELPEPLDLTSLRGRLNRKTGCQLGAPDAAAPFRDAAADVGIKNLATRDLAAASATPHPDAAGRLALAFAGINDGLDRWTLLFQRGGDDQQVVARPVARLVNVEAESASILAFEAPSLEGAAEPFKLDAAKPLKVSWTMAVKPLESSYVTVQIGRAGEDHALYCVFPADKRTATIDAKLVQGLEDGPHPMLVELASSQLVAKEGWLVMTHDWRSATVEK